MFSQSHLSLQLRRNIQSSAASAAFKMIEVLCVICAVLGVAQAQFNLLASFNGTDGSMPQTALVQGPDGNFYGTTQQGGTGGEAGLIYRVTPTGDLSVFYNFCSQPNCADGDMPDAALTLGADGNFYGTTTNAGSNGHGTIFQITPAGVLTTLYSFCQLKHCPDGAVPRASLVLASDGNFYGTTNGGGQYGDGTVFRISPAGVFRRLYSFCSQPNCADGSGPFAALVQGNNGKLYGSTYDGGATVCSFFGTFGCGTIFEITLSGHLTTLYNFGTDAGLLTTPLVLARNGNLYGTSRSGGSGLCGNCGTVFQVTPAGEYSVLYSFCTQQDCPDGAYPMAGLVQATNGILYGSTSSFGSGGEGTLFGISASGMLHTIYNFEFSSNGMNPEGSLAQATDGKLYGLTNLGGANNSGTIFSFSTGLAPFVETVPITGTASTQVLILGNSLSTASAVSFNGTPASFTVVSDTEIETTVPSAASSGTVTVATSTGTLNSNITFRVLP